MPDYLVRIVRPRFDVAIVQVTDVEDEDVAIVNALITAKTLPEDGWALEPFQDDAYSMHVQDVLDLSSESETEKDLAFHEQFQREFCEIPRREEVCRYILLHANLFSSEGVVLLQPWLLEEDMMRHEDLCGDWEKLIKNIRKNGSIQIVNETIEKLEAGKTVPVESLPAWCLKTVNANDNAPDDEDANDTV